MIIKFLNCIFTMKRLSFFSALLMAAGVFLFLGGCQKEESTILNNENDAISQQFLGLSSIQTKCQANNPNNPPVRLKQPDSTQQKRNVFISEIKSSGNFTLTNDFIEAYGNPVAELGLYFENKEYKKLIIPIVETKATKVTSFFEIAQVTNRSLTYKFNNREYNDYYLEHRDHKARPDQNRLNLYAYYYKLFDYAICETDNIPTITTDINETPICMESIVLWEWVECMAVASGQTEAREACGHWDNPDIYQVEVPCPQGNGSGGSGDGGGPGNGPGGNGTGGNGSTGGSSNAILNAFLSDLDFISQWIDDDVINKLFNIINMSDKSEDCLSIIKTFTSTLRNNNYSQSAIQALNCIGSGLGVNIHPSAPDDCYFSMETSLPDIMSNFANFPPLIYGITIQNTPLAHLPCELANSQLTMTQITNLVNAIDNFLPDDQNQGLGVDGEPGSGLYPGLDVSYEWIADELVDLMTTYPQLNFDQADMEWLMNNYYSSLQKIRDFLFFKVNKLDATKYVNRINNLRNTEPDIRWDRSLEFYNVLGSNTNASTACGNPPSNISDWSDVASFVPPSNVLSKLTQLGEGWRLQGLQTPTAAPSINLDYFSTTITQMPINPNTGQPWSPDAFFQHLRKNFNDFVDTNNSEFIPIAGDEQLWLSNNPVPTVISIDINLPFGFPGDDGSVICAQNESCCWIFSTVKAPFFENTEGDGGNDGYHPVSGNRQFGFTLHPNGSMEIYTRGVDRFLSPTAGPFSSSYALEELAGYLLEKAAFTGADALWDSFQNGIKDYVTNPIRGGQAQINTPVKNRPKVGEALKQLLKQGTPITHVPCGN